MTKKRWRNPDKRMAHAVELRKQGWSLRQIGVELNVDARTVRRDLAKFDAERQTQATVIPLRRGNKVGHAPPDAPICPSAMPQEGSAS